MPPYPKLLAQALTLSTLAAAGCGSQLHTAINAGAANKVDRLLKEGADPNAIAAHHHYNRRGKFTALERAAASMDEPSMEHIIVALLEAGANPNGATSTSRACHHRMLPAPLPRMVLDGEDAIVRLLLEHGAEPRLWPCIKLQRGADSLFGFAPRRKYAGILSVAIALYVDGVLEMETLDAILAHGGSVEGWDGRGEVIPLVAAARAARLHKKSTSHAKRAVEAVDWLIDNGANINTTSPTKRRVLDYATGNNPLMKAILAHGGTGVCTLTKQDDNGNWDICPEYRDRPGLLDMFTSFSKAVCNLDGVAGCGGGPATTYLCKAECIRILDQTTVLASETLTAYSDPETKFRSNHGFPKWKCANGNRPLVSCKEPGSW